MLSAWQKPLSLMKNDCPLHNGIFSVMFTVVQNNVFFSVDKSAVCHQRQVGQQAEGGDCARVTPPAVLWPALGAPGTCPEKALKMLRRLEHICYGDRSQFLCGKEG